ncbi:MAG: DinB family protein [bacterium]|nr:DinB family protein [bacterium]
MKEVKKLHDQLRRAFLAEAWHGPAVMEALDGITADKAAARPLPNAHSIWELTLHIAAWKRIVADRLEGRYEQPSDEEDWPSVADTGEVAWEKALQLLKDEHQRLEDVVSKMDDALLNQAIPDWEFTRYYLLQGVIQHDLYHAGQIAMLKKALA